MTAEKVRRSEVIMDCYRSRMIARVPRVAEMSAGFIKRHRESFPEKKCVDNTASALITYFFPRYTCVATSTKRSRGVGAPLLPGTECKHVLWCQTTPDSAAAAALSCVVMLQHHPAVRMWYCIQMRLQGD